MRTHVGIKTINASKMLNLANLENLGMSEIPQRNRSISYKQKVYQDLFLHF